ncbi:MAG: isopentenyl phosphate kinase [Candidatus Thermoplasmatota archaeon]
MYLIKIGGSVITDKSEEESFKKQTMDDLSEILKKTREKTIVVHGAGSYGHIPADKHRLHEGYREESQLEGFSETLHSVQKLNSLVLESLNEKEIKSVSLPPHNSIVFKEGSLDFFEYSFFEKYVQHGFTPVTFGDVVFDKDQVFSICSGDILMEQLSYFFRPEKTVFVIDEDGLYTSNPKKDKNAEFIDCISVDELMNLSASLDNHADVTGGMKGKIETIKNIAIHGIDVVLVNGNKPDRVYEALIGKKTVCTVVKGDK